MVWTALALSVSAAAAEKSFIWKVDGPGGVAYILGSIHMVRPEMYPLAPVIEEAFAKCDVLVVEADVFGPKTAELQNKMMAEGMYPEGDSLAAHISDRTRDQMSRMMIDLNVYQKMRPWLTALVVQTQRLLIMGYDPNIGIDKYFYEKALAVGKEIGELESADSQVRLFADMPPDQQEMLLYSTLVELDGAEGEVAEIFAAWKSGDQARFHDLFMKTYKAHPEMTDLTGRLIFDRNDRMTDKIAGWLNMNRTWFVVVGAGHLTGERGIISQLERRGFRVEQM